jgi:hypothetical protein
VLWKSIYWINDFTLLFSSESAIFNSGFRVGGLKQWAYFLLDHKSNLVSTLWLTVTIVLSLYLLVLKPYARLFSFFLWFLVLNINDSIYSCLNGGDYLLQQLLFFNVLLSSFRNISRPDLDRVLHNFGVFAIRLQLCMVYLIAGLTKLADEEWLGGSAISDILKIREFSLPYFYDTNGAVAVTANYFVMLYQIGFPLLVWWTGIKKPLIMLGILQHIIIAFVLGLPSFGFIMIISYSIFYFPFFINQKTENS